MTEKIFKNDGDGGIIIKKEWFMIIPVIFLIIGAIAAHVVQATTISTQVESNSKEIMQNKITCDNVNEKVSTIQQEISSIKTDVRWIRSALEK